MAAFLLVPLNFNKQIFTIGALFYAGARAAGLKSVYARPFAVSALSAGEKKLTADLALTDVFTLAPEKVEAAFAAGRKDDIYEEIAALVKDIKQDCLWIEGPAPVDSAAYLFPQNRLLAALAKAVVIFLVDAEGKDPAAVAHLLKIYQAENFETDTVKLGYVLTGCGKNPGEFGVAVAAALAAMQLSLPCLLATAADFSAVDSSEKLSEIAAVIDFAPVRKALAALPDQRSAPPVFRRQIIDKAAALNKKIVLPEGAEVRTVEAALICASKKIARCVLLATAAELTVTLKTLGIKELPAAIEVVDPGQSRGDYVDTLCTLRKSKGLTPAAAEELLADNVYLGTMMLQAGVADGLVSGAVHTTANTIRPALQIIKTAVGSTMVSSVFFMLMPNEVYVFGDCAVNPELTAAAMAEVAIQAHDSAVAFGINPKVAMISFSTHDSGTGPAVDKVREATRIVRDSRSDIVIDGPLQYDAASVPAVAAKKAPGSSVAGVANVFIFPDLTTGNTVYKAVQRTGNILSIGPMLQGLKKAVNDLSRGATVEDIVFTIAITAIQAAQKES